MEGINPDTGLSVSGREQAAFRLRRAITTQLGSRERRRKVGSEVPRVRQLANEQNRMVMINRIYRAIANSANELADIETPKVRCSIHGEGFRTVVTYSYQGVTGSIEL